MITKFLSNKHNVYGLLVACYVMLGTMFAQYLTIQQVILVVVIVVASNLLWYTLGIVKGMVISALRSTQGWDKVIEKIKNMENDK